MCRIFDIHHYKTYYVPFSNSVKCGHLSLAFDLCHIFLWNDWIMSEKRLYSNAIIYERPKLIHLKLKEYIFLHLTWEKVENQMNVTFLIQSEINEKCSKTVSKGYGEFEITKSAPFNFVYKNLEHRKTCHIYIKVSH